MTLSSENTVQRLLIDGTWQQAADAHTYAAHDPFTGEVASRAAAAVPADVVRAVEAAERAFPTWAALAANERRRVLWTVGERLEARADEMAAAITTETGGPAGWGRHNASVLAERFRHAASAVHEALTGEVIPSETPGRTSVAIRKPVGVVACVIPWNAPALLVGNSVPNALAVGNTVVMKASEQTPRTHGLIAECLTEAGLPAGVYNLVTNAPENAPEVVDALIAHPAVRRVHFTGSTLVGRIIAERTAAHLKKAILELGGKAPVLVLADADLDQAVSASAFGAFTHSGQGCLSTERIIVDRAVADEFNRRLALLATTVPFGDPLDPHAVLGPVVGSDTISRLSDLVREAVAAGARLLAGGTPDGPCFAPTVLTGVTQDMRIYREESFGPLVTVITVDGPEEALRVANDNDYWLASAVFTRNIPLAIDLAQRINAGRCHIYGTTLGAEPPMPFGGARNSGYGRPGGRVGLQEFTELQWITIEGPQPPRHPDAE
ncbi:aldehyde dehydrogenase family protein [Streptomyces sp. MI02-2A]|uniref:aldehyde dehydrogenase family protein n=1 Tax=unclassified Streptomyces TaxID=2593676 RepID=UPI00099E7467|nr:MULTISPECIES: aldehyde dehydrogenase family protein [unclassified Streptomyces]MDX3261728.1 aldehyde dehydrogenase family protein [Streptomyces sp. MI02-2A]REE59363.1 vanillin dehydrogenase [Streptomyces sp. 3212.3]